MLFALFALLLRAHPGEAAPQTDQGDFPVGVEQPAGKNDGGDDEDIGQQSGQKPDTQDDEDSDEDGLKHDAPLFFA